MKVTFWTIISCVWGGIKKRQHFCTKLLSYELRDAFNKRFFLWLENPKVKELTKEELKKEKEKPGSRKGSKDEERKRGKKEKEDDRKDKKIVDSDVSRKESPKSKKDRDKEEVGLDKGTKTKENRKKPTNVKDISGEVARRDKDDRKEGSSARHAHPATGNNQKRGNWSPDSIVPRMRGYILRPDLPLTGGRSKLRLALLA